MKNKHFLLKMSLLAFVSSGALATEAAFEIQQLRPYRTGITHDTIVRFVLKAPTAGGIAPTGTITAVAGAASCSVDATVRPLTCTIRRLTAGVPRLIATYSGDANYVTNTQQWLFATGSPTTRRVSGTRVVAGGFPAHQFYTQNASFTGKALSADGRSATFSAKDRALTEGTDGSWQVYLSTPNSGATVLLSRNASDGVVGNGPSFLPSMAKNSQRIVFASNATNLWPTDGNGAQSDIFLSSGGAVIEKVSTTTAGADVIGASSYPDISDDGRFVVFQSSSKGLTSDQNQVQGIGIFLKDTQNGQVTLISGPTANGYEPKISGNANYVYFVSDSPQFTVGGHFQIIRYERTTAAYSVVSSNSGVPGNSDSYFVSVNATGSQVGFVSFATNLTIATDTRPSNLDGFVWSSTNGAATQISSIFSACDIVGEIALADTDRLLFSMRDQATGCTSSTLWQLTSGALSEFKPATKPNAVRNSGAAVSSNGTFVLYGYRPALKPLDSFDDFDLILSSGVTNEYISANQVVEANFDSESPVISPLGRYIGFTSYASNLVPNDTNSYKDFQSDAFVFDSQTFTTTRVNQEVNGTTGSCFRPYCNAKMLGVTDSNEFLFTDVAEHGAVDNSIEDIYFKTSTGVFERISRATDGSFADADSRAAEANSDGRSIIFQSEANNLTVGDTAFSSDIFVRDRQLGTTTLISRKLDGTPAGGSLSPSITQNANQYAFCSSEALDTSDTNGVYDCYTSQPGGYPTRVVGELGQLNAYSGPLDISNSSTTNRAVLVTNASNVKAGVLDFNAKADVYLFMDGQIRLLTAQIGSPSITADGNAYDAKLSPDGSKVVILSKASNLVTGDTNDLVDVFVYDVANGVMSRIVPPAFGGVVNSDAKSAAITGIKTVFATESSFVTGDTNGWSDIYIAN